MFIDIKMLDGSTISISPRSIVRFRAAFTSEEPENSTVLDYGPNRVYCAETPETIVGKANSAIKAIQLTMPNDHHVYVDGNKISELKTPINGVHHPKANCLVFLGSRLQQVQEDRSAIMELLSGDGNLSSDNMLLSSLPVHFYE